MTGPNIERMHASVIKTVGTDSYLLAPAWYQKDGQANFLPPEVTTYVANALIFAFAGGLVATLQPAAALAGKTVGKWISEKLQTLLGSNERVKDVTDDEVAKTIKELKEAAAKGEPPDKTAEVKSGLKNALRGDFGLTEKRATDIADAVSEQVETALA